METNYMNIHTHIMYLHYSIVAFYHFISSDYIT